MGTSARRRRIGAVAAIAGLLALAPGLSLRAAYADTPSPSASTSPPTSSSPSTSSSATTSGAGSSGADTTGTADDHGDSPEPDIHDTAALVRASAALTEAQSRLDTARETAGQAQADLAAATAAAVQAQADLDAAVLGEQRAERDLSAVQTRLVANHDLIGALARAQYQSQGRLGEWALVLETTSPQLLADRLASLQQVASASNSIIADLERDRADLINTQARLAATREASSAARDAAEAAVTDKTTKAAAADAAQQVVEAEVSVRAAALAAAQDAEAGDRAQYENMQVQSGALAQRISGLAKKLAKGKDAPQGTGHFDRPGRGVVTSPYGPRLHPILHYLKIHTGIDFAVADDVVYAADDGVVLLTEANVAYGNMTVIDHGTIGGRHLTTLYAHQAAFAVKPGDHVTKGQPIGLIGSTGYATGPHLHFEVRIDGGPVDPAPYLVAVPLPPALPAAVAKALAGAAG